MSNAGKFFDEMFGHSSSQGGEKAVAREPYAPLDVWMADEDLDRLRKKSQEAEEFFRRTGITFNVYGAEEAAERLIPFDVIPRIISSTEWSKLSKGIEQRVRAKRHTNAEVNTPASVDCNAMVNRGTYQVMRKFYNRIGTLLDDARIDEAREK